MRRHRAAFLRQPFKQAHVLCTDCSDESLYIPRAGPLAQPLQQISVASCRSRSADFLGGNVNITPSP
eukprot:scaffold4813_cov77-Phaeocystis_antarctica.AAC.4